VVRQYSSKLGLALIPNKIQVQVQTPFKQKLRGRHFSMALAGAFTLIFFVILNAFQKDCSLLKSRLTRKITSWSPFGRFTNFSNSLSRLVSRINKNQPVPTCLQERDRLTNYWIWKNLWTELASSTACPDLSGKLIVWV